MKKKFMKTLLINVAKVGAAVVAAGVTAEVFAAGGNCLASDVEVVKDKISPDVYMVKEKGFLKKPYKVTVDTFGNMKKYEGSKEPKNEKVIKMMNISTIRKVCVVGMASIGAAVGFDYTLRRLGGLKKRQHIIEDLDLAEIEPDPDFKEVEDEE